MNVPDTTRGVGRPDVLAAAVALRWSRPDLTRLLTEHLVEEADALADRDGWLVAAGWRLHAVHSVGDGRDVAADLLDEVRRWDDGALGTAAAGRLRVELAVVAHDAGEAAAAAALLAPGVAGDDPELAADHAVAVARCAGPGTGDELAGAEDTWAAVEGPRAGLGAASVRLVAAVTDRRAGRPEQAAAHAVAGLTRLDRTRGGVTGATPSGHLAAALAAEWIAALVDARRWAQARDVIAGLAARLGERTRPTRQLAYLRSTIARVLATDPDADAGEELERAARDAAAADVPDLEHVCRVALGELHEAHGRLEDALESIRLAVLAERRHRARATRLRTALADLDGLLPRDATADRTVRDPAVARDTATAADEQGPDGPADAVGRTAVLPAVVPGRRGADPGTSPWATGSWVPAGPPTNAGARPAASARTPAAGGTDDPEATRSRHRRPDPLGAAGAPAGGAAANGVPAAAAGGAAGSTDRGSAARDAAGRDALDRGALDRDPFDRGPHDSDGRDRAGAARSGDGRDTPPPASRGHAADPSDREASGSGRPPATTPPGTTDDGREDRAGPRAGSAGAPGADPATGTAGSAAATHAPDEHPTALDGPADQRAPAGRDLRETGGSASPGGGSAPPAGPQEITDPWLAAALAELDRIWNGGTAPEAEGCTVVLDLTRGADRLPDGEAAATMRAVAERLDGRLPAGARMRSDSPGALSVVMPGTDRTTASEWIRTAVPDLAEGITAAAALGGALLRASVHGTDGVVGAQVLQRVGGAAASGPGRRTDRFLSPVDDRDQRRTSARSDQAAEGRAERVQAGSVRPTRTSGGPGTGGPGSTGTGGSDPAAAPASAPPTRATPVPASVTPPAASATAAPEPAAPESAAPEPAAPAAGSVPAGSGAPDIDPADPLGTGPIDPADPLGTGPVEAPRPAAPTPADAPSGGPSGAAASASDDAAARAEAVRRPYLPDGVVVRPGSGGRRYRRPEDVGGAPPGTAGAPAPTGEPPRDGGASGRPGADAGAERSGAAEAAEDPRPERGGADAGPAGTTGSNGRAPSPPADRTTDAEPDASPARTDADRDQPGPEGLGLADLLAGALAAYRRI